MHENDFFNEDLLCALAGVAGEDNVLMSEPMREHTTFKIGGPADVFVTPDTEQGLVATLDTCYRCDLPLTIVGNGSDLLVGDKGIRGVVVALGEGLSAITVDGTHVTAAAGALLSDVAATAAEACLTGMEPISGIPGSVGGACDMNAGAYGACMADVLESVRVYKPARQLDDGTRGSGNIIEFDVDELNLGYRKSRIADDGFIVLSATFNLAPGNAAMIKADMDDYRQRREDKQPLDMPSAGSTFKRPEGYFAGKLIMDAGLQGQIYSERSAVTGLHLAALRAGIRPPRMVSRVASTIRINAALGGSTAVTLLVPAMEWMSMLPGISSSRHRPTPITPEHRPMMKVSALNTSETLCLDAPMARRIPISLRRSSTLI